MFLFVSVLARPDYRLVSSAIYLGAVFAVLALHRAWLDERAAGWRPSSHQSVPTVLRRRRRGAGRRVLAGARRRAAVPGAGRAPLWDLAPADRAAHGDVSPLVDIRGRLVDQTDQIVFKVTSPAPSYWRLIALDTFDGKIWSSEDVVSGESGDLPDGRPDHNGRPRHPDVHITNLVVDLVARRLPPVERQGIGNVGFDVELGEPHHRQGLGDSDDTQYTVTSVVPRSTPTARAAVGRSRSIRQMRGATWAAPGLSAGARDQAVDDTANAATRVRRGARRSRTASAANFTYDLSCEQATVSTPSRASCRTGGGTASSSPAPIAAMARSLGLPARVAVGFTPGELHQRRCMSCAGRRPRLARGVVRRRRLGAVRADARPRCTRRGALHGRAGHGKQRRARHPAIRQPPTAAPGEPGAGPSIPTGEEFASLIPGENGGNVEAVGSAVTATRRCWPQRLLVAPAASSWPPACRGSWSCPSPDAASATTAAVGDDTGRPSAGGVGGGGRRLRPIAGIPPKRPETTREFAARAATATPVPHRRMRRLADDASAAQYSGDPLPGDVAVRAEAAVAEIEHALSDTTPLSRKVLGNLDPRPLRRPAAKRKVSEAEHPVRV